MTDNPLKTDPPIKDTRTRYVTIHKACPPHVWNVIKIGLLELDDIDVEDYRGTLTVLSAGER